MKHTIFTLVEGVEIPGECEASTTREAAEQFVADKGPFPVGSRVHAMRTLYPQVASGHEIEEFDNPSEGQRSRSFLCTEGGLIDAEPAP